MAPGQRAPSFEGQASDGRRVASSELLGKAVVLFFFPRAQTPVCTTETRGFRDAYAEIQALGAEVVGVSTDDLETQREFGRSASLPFPLLADPRGEIARSYGVLWPLVRRARRVTFLLDERGFVEQTIRGELSASRHVEGTLEHLRRRSPRG